jgi:hypothetical protein
MKKTLAILALLVSATLSFGELSTTYAPVSYNCNGSATAYAFPYTFFEKTDLNVYVVTSNGVSTLLEEGSGAGKYTVYAANADYSSGATITAGTAYSAGNRFVISRTIPYGQGLVINGDFVPAKPLEQALDKIAGQVQQIKDSVGRTLTIPVTDPSGLIMELPPAETRAGKIAYFTTNGALATIPFIDSGIVYADGTTIDISSSNVISVVDGGIGATQLSTAINSRLNASLTNLAANSVGTTQITNGAVTFAKLDGVSTNVSTTSQTNIVTEGAVKDYADTKSVTEAKNYAMQYSGSVVYTGVLQNTFTELDLSATVGTNRAFVHLRFINPSGNLDAEVRQNGITLDVVSGYNSNQGTIGGFAGANCHFELSTITDTNGIIEMKYTSYAGVTNTTVSVMCYQVLQ